MSALSNNLSELDQLLQDLNSAQFMAEVDRKSGSGEFLAYFCNTDRRFGHKVGQIGTNWDDSQTFF